MPTALELSHLAIRGEQLPPLAFAHSEAFSHELITPVKNVTWVKPAGGLWLSPLTGSGRTAWTDFLTRGGPELYDSDLNCTPMAVAADARILRIDSLDDLREIVSAYLFFPEWDLPIFQQLIDFEKLALDWHGLYLTEAGQWRTRRMDMTMPTLHGWDLESVVIFDASVVWPA